MSQHPSLRIDSVGTKHRNVLKRFERIKKMQEENKWLDRETVYNLPKIKSIKIKVKKTKEAPAEGEAGAVAAAPAAGTVLLKGAAAPKAAAASASAPKTAAAPKGAAEKAKK